MIVSSLLTFLRFLSSQLNFFIIIISSLWSPSEIIVQSVYIATWGAHVSPQKWSFSELLKFCSIKSEEAKSRRWNRLLSLQRSYLPRLYIFRGACVMWVMSLPNTHFALKDCCIKSFFKSNQINSSKELRRKRDIISVVSPSSFDTIPSLMEAFPWLVSRIAWNFPP